MKKLRNPTREQRKLIQKWKMKPEDWMVERDTTEEMVLVHRHFDRVKKIIHKEVKE